MTFIGIQGPVLGCQWLLSVNALPFMDTTCSKTKTLLGRELVQRKLTHRLDNISHHIKSYYVTPDRKKATTITRIH